MLPPTYSYALIIPQNGKSNHVKRLHVANILAGHGMIQKESWKHNSISVSKEKLKGTPGEPVPESPQRWKTKQTEICRFSVNGDPVVTAVPAHWTLLEVLRYQLGYIGTKQGCDKGDCGSCTVRIDGEPHLSCIIPCLSIENKNIQTVESLGSQKHPLVESFAQYGAAQCGFCIPGMLMSAVSFLEEEGEKKQPNVTQETIAQALGGNLCRCTGYTKILQAVEQAWFTMQKEDNANG